MNAGRLRLFLDEDMHLGLAAALRKRGLMLSTPSKHNVRACPTRPSLLSQPFKAAAWSRSMWETLSNCTIIGSRKAASTAGLLSPNN